MDDRPMVIRGAREHNLRNVDLELPRNRLIVFTGVSGSGKSSLAFDTIYQEGQRRYIESLSSGARQVVGQLRRPDVDRIDGLSPAIAIQQKATDSNPRSTVATVTEIYDYLRVFFARLGHISCCGQEVGRQSASQIIERLLALPARSRLQLLAPVVRQRRGEFREIFDEARQAGFVRVRVNGQVLDLAESITLDRRRRHDIELVIDRLVVKPEARGRLADSVELALRHGEGTMIANVIPPDRDEPGEDIFFSRDFACPVCGTSYAEPSPQLFSFNSLQGMCRGCQGLGVRAVLDEARVVPDPSLSINQGAIAPWGRPSTLALKHSLAGLSKHFGFRLETPWEQLRPEDRHVILYGSDEQIPFVYVSQRGRRHAYRDTWGGVAGTVNDRDALDPDEDHLNGYLTPVACADCAGERLNPTARKVVVAGLNISQLCALTIDQAVAWFDELRLVGQQVLIGEDLVREIRGRLNFLLDVGLHYLTLNRPAPSLSGGEGQRIRLASQIGAGLVGVTYVLDEPSIGLHPRDNQHLLATLQRLRDLGNTVIVVEHDEETMRAADLLVDIGPGPGQLGGEVVAAGPPDEVAAGDSLTAAYLRGERQIALPAARRAPAPDRQLVVRGARHNNLRDLDVAFPLGLLIGVTGVSGSGKSSLVNDILYAELAHRLNHAAGRGAGHEALEGLEHLDKVIAIDQAPIGRTPRSNPATYTKALDPIRALFAKLPEALVRGYAPGQFSFNVAAGRCEACDGIGYQRIEMDFLADVWVPCEVCEGHRFQQETLAVRYKGRSIADVLDMTVAEALELFADIPRIQRVLATLSDVGLDYARLGQPAPTLSGGEAQRIKLARELARRATGRTLYVLDEPTTGLHFEDIAKLLRVLQRLVDEGNTVIVIEHNLDVIKCADWLLDLGPEGGAGGGQLLAAGTPETIAATPGSFTGASLRPVLEQAARPSQRRPAAIANGRPSPWAPLESVVVQGARVHNLQNLEAVIPRDAVTVLTGPSGSGKSSLALDTIYAEGQRRYVESLSSYARQFINQLEKPPVDFVSGLSPAISIEQRAGSRNPRSTVGTVTEVYDYLRLLWARLGTRHCLDCGGVVGRQTADEMVDRLQAYPEGTRMLLLAPLQLGRTEEYAEAFERLRRDGFVRLRVDGEVHELEAPPTLDRRRRHAVEIVVDRVIIRPDSRSRVAQAVDLALDRGAGEMLAEVLPGQEAHGIRPGDVLFSRRWTCAGCGRAYEELVPQSFSFNSPQGWCPGCEGLGTTPGVDPALLVADSHRTIATGALPGLDLLLRSRERRLFFQRTAAEQGWPLDRPLEDWPAASLTELLEGVAGVDPEASAWDDDEPWHGLVPLLEEMYAFGNHRLEIGAWRREVACRTCHGARLQPAAALVRLRGLTLGEAAARPLGELREFFEEFPLTPREETIAAEPLREVRRRLQFLVNVGLDYLNLGRASGSLSGGEAQRIRLASQIGSGLTGVLYILDEPTIGLHQRDNRRLLQALRNLQELGNTVLMVEHDPEAIRSGDYILDFGPGAGSQGGQIVASGTPAEICANPASLTGQYLSGALAIPQRAVRRTGNGCRLAVFGATHHNLKAADLELALGTLTVVTGVSGSGKSSLINEVLYPALARELHQAALPVGPYRRLEGLEYLDKVIQIDQQPIGDNPRSNPVIYVGAFDPIRQLYATLPESRARGYDPARFSFNRPGGRCEACWGLGSRQIEMHFLADVWIPCEECDGRRYNAETLEITYHDRSIAEVLCLTVDEAVELFAAVPAIRRSLQTLHDVGLGYLTLGQSALTLSGGEAQRVKLARELSRPATGQTLYLLDEPTTGLHFEDIRRLLEVLDRLVDEGNTVVVIEHNLEVIKHADQIVDLGPEGGEAGGRIVVCGTPEEVAGCGESYTGQALRAELDLSRTVERQATGAAPTLIDDPDERWHRLQLAFSQSRDAVWRGDDLSELLGLLRGLSEEVGEPDWRNREYLTLGVRDARRWWARIRTSRPESLRLMVRTRHGAFWQQTIVKRAGLVPWAELQPPLENRGERVTVRRREQDDEIWFELASPEEYGQPGFRALLADLLARFMETIR